MATRMRLRCNCSALPPDNLFLFTCNILHLYFCFLYNYSRGLFRGGQPTNLEESRGIAAATWHSMGLSVRFKSVAGPKFIGSELLLFYWVYTRGAFCGNPRRALRRVAQRKWQAKLPQGIKPYRICLVQGPAPSAIGPASLPKARGPPFRFTTAIVGQATRQPR